MPSRILVSRQRSTPHPSEARRHTRRRRPGLGTGHGVSIYGSPIWESIGRGGGASTTSVFRGALGLDVGITSTLGATIGVELGQNGAAGSGKPSSTAFGAAVSYVIGAGR